MKYYIDTEFLEGPQRERFPVSLFRSRTVPTIDLISIGIVSEDGREYYAISKDFNLREAWNRYDGVIPMTNLRGDSDSSSRKNYWIRYNVLQSIFFDLLVLERDYLDKQKRMIGYAPSIDIRFNYSNFKRLLGKYGKTNKEIADEIKSFCEPMYRSYSLGGQNRFSHGNLSYGVEFPSESTILKYGLKYHYPNTKPEFYAYYADYDWVVFCWLFGRMMDLPKGFPMYCRDLKQMMDEEAIQQRIDVSSNWEPFTPETLEEGLKLLKEHPSYPKNKNEHSAIDDARWNKKLHEFLTFK